MEATEALPQAERPAAQEPTPEEVQRRWLELRKHRGGKEVSGPEADVDQDDEVEAQCVRCERRFWYVPVKVNGELIRQRQCHECFRSTEAAGEKDDASAAAAKRMAAYTERQERRLELLHEITGNAAEHRAMTLDTFDAAECGEDVLGHVRDFFHEAHLAGPYDPVRGLLMYGGTGNGKTHAAIAAGVNSLLLDPDVDPRSIVFDRSDELIMRIQDCYGRESVFERVLDRRFTARIWILDDLGTEKASEDAARLLTLIFSRRALRPTIVTMNGTLEEMQDQRPELQRVMSRFGPRYFRVVAMNGRDRRFD